MTDAEAKLIRPVKSGKMNPMNFMRFIGPGLLVTIGFIDPGNWAANVAAGSMFGTKLLWVVTLSTIILVLIQHNAAHLGIVTGDCLSESASKHLPRWLSVGLLSTAVIIAGFTAFAEILGTSIALNMLFHIPLKIGCLLAAGFVLWMLFSNSYASIEKWIIGFVSIIGFSFLFELSLVRLDWPSALTGWTVPNLPLGSIIVIMSVLGAVVMPHNLFLHSEVIQSRKWNLEGGEVVKRRLKFEFLDTLFSMVIGWAINSAMILLAAAAFFQHHITVDRLEQAQQMLKPLLGQASSVIFAVALLFAGLASSVTAGMAGGSIFAGIFKKPYNIADSASKTGIGICLGMAVLAVFLVSDPFKGLVYSQVALSIQLPITVFLLVSLTSSRKVMGQYVNSPLDKIVLWTVAAVVSGFNILLLLNVFGVIK